MKYHIEKNTVQETLAIPLFGRLICAERFPELFSDPEAKRLCDSPDYDFAEKRKKMESPAGLFGALEAAQRQYDLCREAEAYLKEHPNAAVVNLGCGLDDTFRKCANGTCRPARRRRGFVRRITASVLTLSARRAAFSSRRSHSRRTAQGA